MIRGSGIQINKIMPQRIQRYRRSRWNFCSSYLMLLPFTNSFISSPTSSGQQCSTITTSNPSTGTRNRFFNVVPSSRLPSTTSFINETKYTRPTLFVGLFPLSQTSLLLTTFDRRGNGTYDTQRANMTTVDHPSNHNVNSATLEVATKQSILVFGRDWCNMGGNNRSKTI